METLRSLPWALCWQGGGDGREGGEPSVGPGPWPAGAAWRVWGALWREQLMHISSPSAFSEVPRATASWPRCRICTMGISKHYRPGLVAWSVALLVSGCSVVKYWHWISVCLTAKPSIPHCPASVPWPRSWLANRQQSWDWNPHLCLHPAQSRPQGLGEKISKMSFSHTLCPNGPGWYQQSLIYIF